MSLKINDLERPQPSALEFFENEGDTAYHKAFKRHFHCGNILNEANLRREAYLSYLLAAECLLKDLYVLCRLKIFSSDPLSSPAVILCSGTATVDRTKWLQKNASAPELKHNFAKLLQMVKELLPELDRVKPERFNAFSRAIEVDLNWAKLRYEDPDKGISKAKDWVALCANIAEATCAFVTKDLALLYPEGLK